MSQNENVLHYLGRVGAGWLDVLLLDVDRHLSVSVGNMLMTRREQIEVLELIRDLAARTCARCIRTYEVPISVMVDECSKELARLSEK